MSTSVSVPEDGEYELSFEHSVRYNAGADEWSSGYLMEILATIDGDEVVRIPARDASNYGFLPASGRIFLTAGQHVLKFETDDGPEHQLARASGPMVFIDAVRLVGSKASFADNEGTWNFAAGRRLTSERLTPSSKTRMWAACAYAAERGSSGKPD